MLRLLVVTSLVFLPVATEPTSGTVCPSLLQRDSARAPTHANLVELEESSTGGAKCEQFASHCHVDPQVIDDLESWEEAKGSFELCCLAGGHTRILCSSLADEAFEDRRGPFSPSEDFCDEMMSLMQAHEDWALDPAILFSKQVTTRMQGVLKRVRELHAEVPRLIERGFRPVGSAGGMVGMAGLAFGAHARSSGALVVATLSMIATTMQKCDNPHMWVTFCQERCDGPIDLDNRECAEDSPDTNNECCHLEGDQGECEAGGGGGGGGGGDDDGGNSGGGEVGPLHGDDLGKLWRGGKDAHHRYTQWQRP